MRQPAETLDGLDCGVAYENDEANDTTTEGDRIISGAVRNVLLAAMADTRGRNSLVARTVWHSAAHRLVREWHSVCIFAHPHLWRGEGVVGAADAQSWGIGQTAETQCNELSRPGTLGYS